MQLSVKNVDERIFKEFKAEAVKEGIIVGKFLNIAMHSLVKEKKKERRPKSLLEFKPKNWGKGTERTSEEIDKVLYE